MEILLDQKSIEIDTGEAGNLEQILLKIMGEEVPPGNVIASVKVNRASYSEKKPHEALSVHVRDISLLEITTIRKEEVVWPFLEAGIGQLDLIIKSAVRVSRLFRIADEAEANDHYADLLHSLRLFMRMVKEAGESLFIDFATILFKDTSVNDRVEKFGHIIGHMLSIQEKEDWVMLADIIDYELIALLDEWKLILPMIKK